jgi:hypothetical protein
MFDGEHIFVTNRPESEGEITFMIFKLDWEKESFKLKCKLIDSSADFDCDLPILKIGEYLIVAMYGDHEARYCLLKVDLNIYKIEKSHDIRIPVILTREPLNPDISIFCHGLFQDKLLFFQSHNIAEENIFLCCYDLKCKKLDKFDVKLPYGMRKVGFFSFIVELTNKFNVI